MDMLSMPRAAEPAARSAISTLTRATTHGNSSLRYRLLTRLQQSLDVGTILATFREELSGAHLVEGVGFVHSTEGIHETFGKFARFSHVFCLHGLHEAPGELTLYREWPFSRAEIIDMQSCVVLLQNPLRNAMQYRRALAASMADPLTRIGNRNALMMTLSQELAAAQRYRQPLSLAIIDLDKFKIINDHHGHSAGDLVLQTAARVLAKTLRNADLCFRFGGDEFVILLKHTGMEGAAAIGERLRHRLERTVIRHDRSAIRITASIGVAGWREGDTTDSLFDRADHAMYAAKSSGGNVLRTA